MDLFYIKYLVFGYMRQHMNCIENIPPILGHVPCKVYIQPQIGDRITLKDEKRGIVKYINNKLIGIELDEWCPNSNDTKLFLSPSGRTYFINRQCKGYMHTNSVMEGGYATLTGLVKCPVYNGKMVKIIAWIEKTGRLKVKLVSFAQQFKKYLGVTEQHLEPLTGL